MALARPSLPFGGIRRLIHRLQPVSVHAFENPEAQAFEAIQIERRVGASVPLMCCSAACGFPSSADDYLDRPLDFNELIIENPAATFAVRVAGESMLGAGIFPGDIAVVNRARSAVDGSVVLALVDGEFTIKRYHRRGTRCWLAPENPTFQEIEITEDMAFEVWGVTRTTRLARYRNIQSQENVRGGVHHHKPASPRPIGHRQADASGLQVRN